MKAHRYGIGVLSALLLAVAFASPAAAQDVDGRWMAFYGCWEPTGEFADSGMLCVRPFEDGVELFTVVEGEITTSDVMVSNGEQRTRSMEGCEGWESSEFSNDGRRVFTRSEFVCGEGLPRTSTGVMSLTAPTQWLDVRSMDVDGEQVAWVQEYQLVDPERMAEAGVDDATQGLGLAVRAARMSAARRITLTEVREAAQRMERKAVEAWVAARKDRFELDADILIDLAADGVDESIIDVVVAVSYPETFSIDANAEARTRSDGSRRYGDTSRYGGRYGFGARSFFWDPFYYGSYGYSPFNSFGGFGIRYSNGYGYGPGFGYGSGYGYGGGYYTPVVVERVSPGERGRVVNGRGYSRGSGGSATGSRGSFSGGSGSAARSSGSSRGSSGGRTAKPRRRGGGS
jgi:hypothetical protein